jgi:uncharacterized protein (TIGR03546 family)
MFGFTLIADFFKALRAGQSPGQIAAEFSFAYLIGLMPFFSLQAVLLFILMFFAKVNLAAGGVAILIAGFLAWLLDPIIHSIGFFVLVEIPALQGFWEKLYNLPVAPLTKFYNTIAMGSLLFGILTVWPVYRGIKKLLVKYRKGVEAKLRKMKIVQAFRGSFMYRWYQKVTGLGNFHEKKRLDFTAGRCSNNRRLDLFYTGSLSRARHRKRWRGCDRRKSRGR